MCASRARSTDEKPSQASGAGRRTAEGAAGLGLLRAGVALRDAFRAPVAQLPQPRPCVLPAGQTWPSTWQLGAEVTLSRRKDDPRAPSKLWGTPASGVVRPPARLRLHELTRALLHRASARCAAYMGWRRRRTPSAGSSWHAPRVTTA
jgi:hypothetical protein